MKTTKKVAWARKQIGTMFKTTKNAKARGKAMKTIWRQAKTKFG